MNKVTENQAALEEKYTEMYSLRKRFEGDIKEILGEILTTAGYEVVLLCVRTKEIQNFIAKANRQKDNGKGNKYSNPTKQITDITGARIVVQYKDKAHEIDNLLRDKLNVDVKNSKDTIAEAKPNQFGYPAIHIVASISDDLAQKYNCQCIRDWKIEIQIRTVLEHAWAELSRSIFYNREIPEEHVRDLSELAARVERTDRDYIELRQKVGQLISKSTTPKSKTKCNISVPEVIDMLNTSEVVKEIGKRLAKVGLTANKSARNDYAERISNIFGRQGAESRQQAEEIMNKNIELIVDACVLHMKATDMKAYPTDSLLEAALAIVDNGDITAEEYSNNWSDRWKNGIRKASKEYHEKHKR